MADLASEQVLEALRQAFEGLAVKAQVELYMLKPASDGYDRVQDSTGFKTQVVET